MAPLRRRSLNFRFTGDQGVVHQEIKTIGQEEKLLDQILERWHEEGKDLTHLKDLVKILKPT